MRRRQFRRRARNAPDQVNQRRSGMGVTWPVSPKQRQGTAAPQTESAKCTGSSSHD